MNRQPISFFILFGFLYSGCSITQSTVVKDEYTQNAVMQPSALPHLQGPSLKAKQTRVQGRYTYTGDTNTLPSASSKALGHLTPQHHLYGQVAFPLTEGSAKSNKAVWEMGLFGGGSLSTDDARRSNQSQNEDTFADTSMPFLKAGLGVRGPLLQKKRFLLGLNLEGEVGRQAFRTDLSRTQTITTTVEWNEQIAQDLGLERQEDTVTVGPLPLEEEGYFFTFTPRAGLYGQIKVLDFLSLDLGFSVQYIQYQQATGENECTYEKSLTDLSQLSDPENLIEGECSADSLYPLSQYHVDLTYYGGATLSFNPFHVSLLFSYATSPFDEIEYSAPFVFATQAGLSF